MFLKYLDNGISCLPIRPREKAAATPRGFENTHYSLHGITEEMAEEWDNKYPLAKGYGIAVLCGKASNIIAVDVDISDDKLLSILPHTPCSKVGKKGGTFFYQYEDKWETKKIIKAPVSSDGQIEILTNGQYTVIPPSIHPETNRNYEWIGEDLLFVKPKDLPFFTDEAIAKIHSYWGEKYGQTIDFNVNVSSVELEGPFEPAFENDIQRAPHGSHDRLKRLSAILLQKNTPLDEAAIKLLEYDKNQHLGVTYFGDITRGKDGSADPYSNALRFYSSIAHQVNTQRRKRGELPHSIAPLTAYNNKIVEEKKPNEILHKMPEARGRLKDFITAVNQYSLNDNSEIGFAYGLAYLSMHLACRYTVNYRGTYWPANLLIFVVASSGMGKNKPRKFMEELLHDFHCMGASEYTSAVSLLNEFTPVFDKKGTLLKPSKRALLASIDEVDGLLTIMSKSRESFEARFKKILIEIFDASRDQFYGQFSKGSGKEGDVKNPYFTLIGSTQPTYFKKALLGDIAEKGFYQRSLIFELKQFSEPDLNKRPNKDIEKQLRDFTKQWFENNPISVDMFDVPVGRENEYPVQYRDINLTQEALSYIRDLELEFYNAKRNSFNQGNELKTSFESRFIDNIIKLAQIDWLATLPKEYLDKPHLYPMTIDSLKWAKEIVLAKYEQFKEYLSQDVIQTNKDEIDMEKIVNFIKRKNGKVTGEQLSSGVRIGMSARRRELVKELQDRGVIQIVSEQSEGKKPISYYKLS